MEGNNDIRDFGMLVPNQHNAEDIHYVFEKNLLRWVGSDGSSMNHSAMQVRYEHGEAHIAGPPLQILKKFFAPEISDRFKHLDDEIPVEKEMWTITGRINLGSDIAKAQLADDEQPEGSFNHYAENKAFTGPLPAGSEFYFELPSGLISLKPSFTLEDINRISERMRRSPRSEKRIRMIASKAIIDSFETDYVIEENFGNGLYLVRFEDIKWSNGMIGLHEEYENHAESLSRNICEALMHGAEVMESPNPDLIKIPEESKKAVSGLRARLETLNKKADEMKFARDENNPHNYPEWMKDRPVLKLISEFGPYNEMDEISFCFDNHVRRYVQVGNEDISLSVELCDRLLSSKTLEIYTHE